ncbi:MAG: NAD(P)/FAD-dependent oxidoreductase [Nitrososphaerales archaeon]
MEPDFDVIVAGGGVCGLIAAREIASSNLRVYVLEEDFEIGIPERCAGLISVKALSSLGLFPSRKIVNNEIKRALIHSPLGSKVEVEATNQRVIVLNRREFDRELARIAERNGAFIDLGQKVLSVENEDGLVKVKTAKYERSARILVDARGLSSLKPEHGILQAAQYDIQGSWFEKDRVEVYLDNEANPGFFKWLIPLNHDTARLGVAGYSINPFEQLDKFAQDRKAKVMKKVASPIFIGGTSRKFVHNSILYVGDAAGQTKPTTGGGIFTGGTGAVLAGRAISESLINDDLSALRNYEVNWRRIFGKEFTIMSQARKIYERMDNGRIDKMVKVLSSSNILDKLSNKADFDYHSIGISQILSIIKERPSLALDLIKSGLGVMFDMFKS